jgi:hypothetical protein
MDRHDGVFDVFRDLLTEAGIPRSERLAWLARWADARGREQTNRDAWLESIGVKAEV